VANAQSSFTAAWYQAMGHPSQSGGSGGSSQR